MKKITNNHLIFLSSLVGIIIALGAWLLGFVSTESLIVFSVIGAGIIASINILFGYKNENLDDLLGINIVAIILSVAEFLAITVFFHRENRLFFLPAASYSFPLTLFNIVVPVVIIAIIYLALCLTMIRGKQQVSKDYSVIMLITLIFQIISLYALVTNFILIFY